MRPSSPPTIADPTGAERVLIGPSAMPWGHRVIWGTVVPIGLLTAGIVFTWKWTFAFVAAIFYAYFDMVGVWIAIAVFSPIATIAIASIVVSSVMNSFVPWKRWYTALIAGILRPLALAALAIGLLVAVSWLVIS
ncbi:hypothetical protein ACFL2H_02485 [Planctomycetota bacterium]